MLALAAWRTRREDGRRFMSRGRAPNQSLFNHKSHSRLFSENIHYGSESQARASVTFADRRWKEVDRRDRVKLIFAMNEARNRALVVSRNERLSPGERERGRQAHAVLTSWVDAHKGKASKRE